VLTCLRLKYVDLWGRTADIRTIVVNRPRVGLPRASATRQLLTWKPGEHATFTLVAIYGCRDWLTVHSLVRDRANVTSIVGVRPLVLRCI